MTALTAAERAKRYRDKKRDGKCVTMQMVRDAIRDAIQEAIPIIVQQVIGIVTSQRDEKTVTSHPLNGPPPKINQNPLPLNPPSPPPLPTEEPYPPKIEPSRREICQRMILVWREELGSLLPVPGKLSEARLSSAAHRFHDDLADDIEAWRVVCRRIKASPFLTGENGEWRANFDFAVRSSSFQKIQEGVYDRKSNGHDRTAVPLHRPREDIERESEMRRLFAGVFEESNPGQ